jgi:hypothetical protein
MEASEEPPVEGGSSEASVTSSTLARGPEPNEASLPNNERIKMWLKMTETDWKIVDKKLEISSHQQLEIMQQKLERFQIDLTDFDNSYKASVAKVKEKKIFLQHQEELLDKKAADLKRKERFLQLKMRRANNREEDLVMKEISLEHKDKLSATWEAQLKGCKGIFNRLSV